MRNVKTRRSVSRRRFLETTAAGGGLLFLPSYLSGCGAAPSETETIQSTTRDSSASQSGHFARYGVDERVISNVLRSAMDKGGDYADLFFQYRRTNALGLEDGEVNRAYSDIKLGCGVRVLKGDQTGFAFTEDLTEAALISAARNAAVVSNQPGAELDFTLSKTMIPKFYAVELPWSEVGIDQKIPFAIQADSTARSVDPRVAKVIVYMVDQTEYVLVADSEGRMAFDDRPMTECRVSCTAVDGTRVEQNSVAFGKRAGFEQYTQNNIVELAKDAANRTIFLFDAQQPEAGEYAVVLAPGISGMLLHEAIGHGMEADFNRKGTSVYANRIGTQIAPKFVSILDNATNPNHRGSLNVDDEGVPGQRTVLVENGILKSYLHDRISAKHYGLPPTGNGRRQDYRYPPVPRMRNTYMLNGPHNPGEIIRSVKKGIYAEKFANGQVDIGAGDFAFYLQNGYLIEDGKLTQPIKDANMIGFGPKILEEIEMVGNDMILHSGAGTCGKDGQGVPVGMGLPTVKCPSISVGGRG